MTLICYFTTCYPWDCVPLTFGIYGFANSNELERGSERSGSDFGPVPGGLSCNIDAMSTLWLWMNLSDSPTDLGLKLVSLTWFVKKKKLHSCSWWSQWKYLYERKTLMISFLWYFFPFFNSLPGNCLGGFQNLLGSSPWARRVSKLDEPMPGRNSHHTDHWKLF